ncbi:hypothetical protein CBOM_01904 [Ceraceosorus bombacis]|uniref:Uncharacterized protein n=1 Tax=Ceraceosorus bombacis TaxID=401625 RepID=A0A0P1BDQ9_9BASI|nr:hypothetical protein CBOM_01904 [Ceraceosorus bombacis]
MNSKSQSSIYPIPPSHAITPVPQVSELRAATAQLALLQEMKLERADWNCPGIRIGTNQKL